MRVRIAGLMACAAAAWLAGCATAVVSTPTNYVAAAATDAAPARTLTIASTTHLTLQTGYARELAAGSRWRRTGSIPQGDVFRPVDTVFTIEGQQVHEAYLVVSGQALVGFYLPGEGRYSALPAPVLLPLGDH